MAQRIHNYNLTIPAQTDPNTYTVALTFPPGQVLSLTVHLPTGHAGMTGVAIDFGTNRIIPQADGGYFIGNAEAYHVDLDDPFPGGTGWFADLYNTGQHDHVAKLKVELDEQTAADLADLPPVILLPYMADGGDTAPGLPTPGGGGPGGVPIPV